MRLFDWISDSGIPVCRISPEGREHAPVFVIQTQVGAEHFFAVIDTYSDTVEYMALSQVLDTYGMDIPVEPYRA